MLLLGGLLAALPAPAQPKVKGKTKTKTAVRGPMVSAATVACVVRALAADDMQGRGTGQAGGDAKAARFLAAEFARIGLQPLPGAVGFEQMFSVYESPITALAATFNGTVMPADKLLLFSNQPAVEWTDETPGVETLVVGPDDKPWDLVGRIIRPKQNVLVLLAPVHASVWGSLRDIRRQLSFRGTEAGNPYSCLVLLARPAAKAGSKTQSFAVKASSARHVTQLRNVVGVLPGHDLAHAAQNVVFLGPLRPFGHRQARDCRRFHRRRGRRRCQWHERRGGPGRGFQQRHDNARPLLFVAFAAKEVGGFGSQHFGRQLTRSRR